MKSCLDIFLSITCESHIFFFTKHQLDSSTLTYHDHYWYLPVTIGSVVIFGYMDCDILGGMQAFKAGLLWYYMEMESIITVSSLLASLLKCILAAKNTSHAVFPFKVYGL
jgi:hypothetical protein